MRVLESLSTLRGACGRLVPGLEVQELLMTTAPLRAMPKPPPVNRIRGNIGAMFGSGLVHVVTSDLRMVQAGSVPFALPPGHIPCEHMVVYEHRPAKVVVALLHAYRL